MNQPDTNTIEGQMIEVKQDSSIVTIDPAKYAAAAFEGFKKQFGTAKRAAGKSSFDIATKDGMKEAKGIAKSFREIRTGIENARKEAKAPIIEAGKKIDEVAKEFTAEVLPFESKYTKMIEDEEARIEAEKQAKIAAERARIEAIETRIESLRLIPSTLVRADSATIQERLDKLVMQALSPEDFEEHLEIAITAQNTAINELRQLLTETRNREAQAAELARLRAADAEREEKARLERAAAAKREADMLAQMEEMKRQLAAMQAAAAPAIVTDMAEPRSDADVVMPIELDDTGVVVGEAVLSSEAVEQLAEPAPAATGGARLAVPPAKRLSDLDILEVVARAGDVPNMTALAWLATFDVEAVRTALAEGE